MCARRSPEESTLNAINNLTSDRGSEWNTVEAITADGKRGPLIVSTSENRTSATVFMQITSGRSQPHSGGVRELENAAHEASARDGVDGGRGA